MLWIERNIEAVGCSALWFWFLIRAKVVRRLQCFDGCDGFIIDTNITHWNSIIPFPTYAMLYWI